MTSGAFDTEFATRKNWKIDAGLLRALTAIIPQGSSVMDLGAGTGKYVYSLRAHGYKAYGLDGIQDIATLSDGLVRQLDLSSPIAPEERVIAYDWCMTIEVGEHIPYPGCLKLIHRAIRYSRVGVVCSWAVPGQRGRDHITCRTPEWVASRFARLGVLIDENATIRARELAGKGWNRKLLVMRHTLPL
jgi:hypothetical protein